MNKIYKRPELEVKSFGIKESILATDLFSQPEFDEDWEDTDSTGEQG